LGGARSGKSAYAEQLALECGEPVLYVATATASDSEMAERIRQHQARRPPAWRTLERSVDLAQGLVVGDAQTVLVEDLALLLSNYLLQAESSAEERTCGDLKFLFDLPANVILVSNEVGMGLVPHYALGRAFRDSLGRLNQLAAARATEVYWLMAGLPLRLKG
jgi:adenosylcobinamide kinase/adenosylcobinamide-phosphate guanylyltransferase